MEKVSKTEWTQKANLQLQSVYEYHAEYSEELAYELVMRIKAKSESIVFPEQYQVDDYNPKYRRMIEGNYKLLFKTENTIVYIMAVFPTKNTPDKLRRL